MKRPGFHIRPLLPTDSLKELTALIQSAYAPHVSNDLRFVGTHQSEDMTRKRFAAGHGLVAIIGERIVGTVVVRPPQPESKALVYRRPDTWSFGQLAVAPAYKGRGLGKALHEAAVKLASSQGARVIALDTAEPAKQLIALYESWGYKCVDTIDWRPHTNYLSVIMLRQLDAVAMPVTIQC